MKIIVFEAKSWTRTGWSKMEHDCEVEFVDDFLTQTNVVEHIDADIISLDESLVNAEILAKFTNLKLIAARSTGVDQIDLEYCQQHGITVCNVPGYAENAVAEHVFALLLSLSHHIVEAVGRTRRNNFSREGIQSFELRGKTLAVVGTGAIGRKVSRIAKGFDMDVVAFDLRPNKKWAADNAIKYLPLEDTLRLADIITLHVPSSEETHQLLSDDQFNLMKDGVVLINTSRGDVVDIHALLRALSSGKIAAAGLDVLPEENAIREEKEQLLTLFGKKNNP